MLIKRITVGGYKNIDKLNIEFGHITAFVGLNNFGKSNILQSIDYAIKFIKETPEGKERMMKYINGIPINKKNAKKNFSFGIEYLTQFEKDKEISVEYEYEFEWPKNKESDESENIGCKIVNESLKIKENTKGQKYNMRINRNLESAYYKSSDTGRCDKSIKIESNNLVLNKLNYYDELFYLNVIEELNNLKFEINSFLDADGAFDISPIRYKDSSLYNLQSDGQNIAEIVYNLQKYDNKTYEHLKNVFMSLFPNIDELDVMETPIQLLTEKDRKLPDNIPFTIVEKVYRIKVKEKTNNQYINFENLSNGTKRIFLFLASIILAEKNQIAIIAFEELENCIHPNLFKRLIELIKSIVKRCRIILTSHSPLLVQYLNIDDIYIGVPIDDGIARFEKVKKSKQKALEIISNNYHIGKGNYIFKLLIDFCEDNLNDELLLYIDLEK